MARLHMHTASSESAACHAASRGIALALALSFALLLNVALAVMCSCPAFADEEHARVAPASQTAGSKVLLREGMAPIAGDAVQDGTYQIQAESSSTFFKIKSAILTVEAGKMMAAIELDSKSYPLVFMGTSAQAAAAPADDYIAFDDESWTFTVPVQALDQDIYCAAYSKNRKQWYDRTLMFYAASLPASALRVEVPEYGDPVDESARSEAASSDGANAPGVSDESSEAVTLDLPDGEYSIEVNMTGGSGRASVSSPTWLIVEGGQAYARLLWSSSYYDYMIVEDKRYYNLTDDGSNSTFKIPIVAMDEEFAVVADTTAMGDPVEIEYHLTFYADTIAEKDAIPQEAAVKVLYIAIAVIIIGGILNHVLKTRRKR